MPPSASAYPSYTDNMVPSSSSSYGVASVPGPASVGGSAAVAVGPKVVKVDKQTRSLMPSTLRVKRNAGSSIEKKEMKVTKREGDVQKSNLNSNNGNSNNNSNTTVSGSVQDAYEDFMAEINMLGAASGD